MKSRHWFIVLVFGTISLTTGITYAMAPFKKAFDKKYVKSSGDEDFRAAFKKTACYTCHIKGKKKHVVNTYGWHLSQFIEGNAKDRIAEAGKSSTDAKKAEQAKILKELEAALKKVEDLETPSGETFAELFTAHELPAADGEQSLRD